MQKLILSLFTLVLLSTGQAAWGADKSLDKSTKPIDLVAMSRLFQQYETTELALTAERAAKLTAISAVIDRDIANGRLHPATRRYLVLKSHSGTDRSAIIPVGDESAEIAQIRTFLDILCANDTSHKIESCSAESCDKLG
jgi:hypothetical protein